MYEVTYNLEKADGKKMTFKRIYESKEMAESEATFQPGKTLSNGSKVIKVTFKKVSK